MLSPPCLGYSSAGEATACHVLSSRTVSAVASTLIPQQLVETEPLPTVAVSHHGRRDSDTLPSGVCASGQAAQGVPFPEPAASAAAPHAQVPVIAPDGLLFLVHLVQTVTWCLFSTKHVSGPQQ